MPAQLDALKVPVTIGGERRLLFYPNGALLFIRRNVGPELFSALSDGDKLARLTADPDMEGCLLDALHVILCAGLLHQQRDMTPEDVAFSLTAEENDGAFTAMIEALNRAAPPAGKAENEEPPSPLPRNKSPRKKARGGPLPASSST